jgi:hypothetical protein
MKTARPQRSGSLLPPRHTCHVLTYARCARARAVYSLDGAAAGSSPGQSLMGGMFGSHGGSGTDHELFGDATDEFLTDTMSKAEKKADTLGLNGVHSHQHKDHTHFMPGESHDDLRERLGIDDGGAMDDSEPMQMTSDAMGEMFDSADGGDGGIY